jgi:SAM-dependent methyltransferase
VKNNIHLCPLCGCRRTAVFWQDRKRDFLQCRDCQLVFVPPEQHLSAREEKAEYDLHQNSPEDQEYRRFLSRLFDPISSKLPRESKGLDFGCGPGPALPAMFEEAGHQMAVYDPFYAPDPAVFDNKYDFITASEVVEHLHRPGKDLDRLWRILRPGGWLGIMTKMVVDREAFSRWHYKEDSTHICFFSGAVFDWLAEHWQTEAVFIGNDVVLLNKG